MTSSSQDQSDSLIPPQWTQSVVITSVHCRGCGYDLQGLRADGRCPECGMPLWESVLHTVDPEASRLPRIRNPRAVGNALVMLTLCMLLATLILVGHPVAQWIDSWSARGNWRVVDWVPRSLSWMSWVIAIGGLWAVWLLKPPRGKELGVAVWLEIWLIAIGWFGWAVCATLWGDAMQRGMGSRRLFIMQLCTSMTSIVGLMGLRGVLGVVGKRSREYRRSRGGRQGVEAIIAAISGAVFGSALQHLARDGVLHRNWDYIGRVILWICTFMILIGLAYLVLNAWWIRRALRKPPPPMDQVLLPQVPPDTWIPDREE